MSVPSNTFQTFQAKGNREDLEDIIYNISPTDTPFMSNAGRGSAEAVFHEWQTDALASASTTNAQVEGDDASAASITATVRIGNYTQIFRKVAQVSGTQDRVKKAGRSNELSYQMSLRSAELKRDIEATALCNQGASAGNTSTARTFGTFLTFLYSNIDKASGGVAPVYTTSPSDVWTDGTQRTFTETILKNVLVQTWNAGGNPKTLMVGASDKQVLAGFSGVATKNIFQTKAEQATIIGGADIYVSDFGNLTVVPNRFQRGRECFAIDWNYVALDYLRPLQAVTLSKTGDSERRMILAELTVKVGNQKAHGIAVDLS